jgi:hypothetical protein
MKLAELLENSRQDLVAEATEALSRAHLPHYSASRTEQNHERLARLYDLTLECVRSRTLLPIITYANALARERHADGFDLQEVQTALNVLEEVIWREITATLEPREYPQAFGLASTILGAAKQALAVQYVALASHGAEVQSLDLSALFKGT